MAVLKSGTEAGKIEIGYARAEKTMKMSPYEIDETVQVMYANMKNNL